MKTKYPSMFGVLAALLLVASFIIPTNLASPSPVEAACVWDVVDMPGSLGGISTLLFNSEVDKLVTSTEGTTGLAVVNHPSAARAYAGVPVLLVTTNGLTWSTVPYNNLTDQWRRDTGSANFPRVVNAAMAPDNPAVWAVVVNFTDAGPFAPDEVYITETAGARWERTLLTTIAGGGAANAVGALDISMDYGGQRDIVVGIRGGVTPVGATRIYVLQSQGFTGWTLQTSLPGGVANADIFALKFSPTYTSDGGLVAVFADNVTGTMYNVALRDLVINQINQWALATNVEVANSTTLNSPLSNELVSAEIQLPSDFSGQAASLRRVYIATDSGSGAGFTREDGIFRIDNTTVYVLMDNQAPGDTRRIASIAYFGTYASGKLLAGEVMGYTCSATVPTWFTDSPTTCPVPCWYPALKPTTGAAGTAGTANCQLGTTRTGNAQVAWVLGGILAFAGTGSNTSDNGTNWWHDFTTDTLTTQNDESAIAISRNNGETWNQLSLIDTTITYFNDFAMSADCNTLYLASASVNATDPCSGFDSVWRASLNGAVVSPLPPIAPIGTWYERVYTRPTSASCNTTQTDLPLLRLAGNCEEPTGMIVAWAAQTSAAQAWSPDYGDYWANITARGNIQDFCFESSTVMYNFYTDGTVQKLPYTGTSWATSQPSVNPGFGPGHMITAMPEGNVMISYIGTEPYPVAISNNAGASFAPVAQALPAQNTAGVHIHCAFDPDFANNSIIYIADDGATGSVYRNNVASPIRWTYLDMMTGAVGCPAPTANKGSFYGLVLAHTGGALYATDNSSAAGVFAPAGVWRTLTPLSGLPNPGIAWDRLDMLLGAGIRFTHEPYSLKLCGCCTMDSDTNLYALDNNNYVATSITGAGWLWTYGDCFAKKGPALITEDKMLVGCDPVSGRAQEVNLCWEQLCIADQYDIEIGKNADFNILVIDWVAENICTGYLLPADLTSPCVYFPAGGLATTVGGTAAGGAASAIAAWGNLECGHTYYWRVKVRHCIFGEDIRSPWSDVRSFTVKAGLPVSSPYLGVQLLSPNNGCLACPVTPASFSWSPLKETTKYHFVLSKNADLTSPIADVDVTGSTAFEYAGTLDYSTNYFWQVKALEPAPSDPSATFSFMTEAAPAAEAGAAKPVPTPVWVWVVIAIGAILVIVTLVLIFKTRRV